MNPSTLCVGCMENDSGEAVCPKCGRPFDLAPQNALQLKPRTMLRDQYLIGRALGHGGFGITYLAWDLGLETRLAIKEYMPNGVAGRSSGATQVVAYPGQTEVVFEWGLDRFMDEARTLKKFSSPGIVSVDTIFRENGTAYLVMEFLDGWTLEEYVNSRGGTVPADTLTRILLPVFDALSVVHADGILHRDISPDNIYLTRAGKVKLIDFGAARNALSQKSRNLSIVLKEGYAPEEQYRSSGIQGPWTDVYATAATFYHAVTGRRPQSALDRQADDRLQRPSALGIQIQEPVEAALMKALSVKAVDRFQSMEDFKAALTATAEVPPPPRPPPPPPGPPPPGPARQAPPPAAPPPPNTPPRRRWLVPAVLGVLAMAGVFVAYNSSTSIRPDRPSPTPTVQPTSTPTPTPSDPTAPPTPTPTVEPSRVTPPPPPTRTPQPPTPTVQPPTPTLEPSRVTPTPTPSPTVPPPPPWVSPTPTFPDSHPTPTPPQNPSKAYARFIEQAKDMARQNNFAGELQVLNQAIQLDPNQWVAYDLAGQVYLYNFNQFPQAMHAYRESIQRGGLATFHVAHDHSAGFTQICNGWLSVSKAGAKYESWNSQHTFTMERAQIREVHANPYLGRNFYAFHLKAANGQNYNLAPMGTLPEAQRDFILSILRN
jgi:serine/threonine protein kinase